MTDNHPDGPSDSEPPSPFAEWAHLSQPEPPTPPPPPPPVPASQPPPIRPPAPEWDPPVGPPAFHRPLPGYGPWAPPPPLFPPAPPGLYPRPDDPLVSADFSGWWNRSIRLLKVVWRPAALVQLVWVVPLIAGGGLVSFMVSDTFTDLANTPPDVQPDLHPLLRLLFLLIPLALLTGLLSLLASLATLHLVVQAALGRPLSVRLALSTARPRVLAYIGWGFVGGLLTLAAFFCCVLPAYYVSTVLLILPTVVLLERGGAIARCFRLFHGRLGDALARLATMVGVGIAVGIVQQAVVSVVALPLGLFSTDGISGIGLFAVATLGALLSGVSHVLLAPMKVTTYADMRARYEPFSTVYLTAPPPS